jgi:hypothetical protein
MELDETARAYWHMLNKGGPGFRSPLDDPV